MVKASFTYCIRIQNKTEFNGFLVCSKDENAISIMLSTVEYKELLIEAGSLSSGTSSLSAGFGGCWLACLCNCIFLLIWCKTGKLMAATSDIPPSSPPNITWVSVALLLIFTLTFAISPFVLDLLLFLSFPSTSFFHTPMMLHHSPGFFERHIHDLHGSVFCFPFL